MMGRKLSAHDVITRASYQLRGQQIPSRPQTEEDELQVYLNQVAKKTSGTGKENEKQKRSINFGDMSDISISEDDFKVRSSAPPGSSKYIKNKPVKDDSTNVNIRSSMPSKGSYKNPANIGALNRAAAVTNSFKMKQAHAAVVSDSDFDMTISTDDSVVKNRKSESKPDMWPSDVNNNDGKRRAEKPVESSGKPKLSKQHNSQTETKTKPLSFLASIHLQSDEESISLGKGGRRFLKKKPSPGTELMSSGLQASTSSSSILESGAGGSPTSVRKQIRFNLDKSKPATTADEHRRSSDQPLKPALKTSSSFRSSDDGPAGVLSSSSSLDNNTHTGASRFIKSKQMLEYNGGSRAGGGLVDDNDSVDGSVSSQDSYRVNLVMDIDAEIPAYTVLHPVHHDTTKTTASSADSHEHKKQKSYDQKRTKSPDQKRAKSPDQKRAKSPDQKRVKSPDQKRTKSPDQKRTKSPDHKRSKSPDQKRTKSPDQKRTKSPDQKRTRSPINDRKRAKDIVVSKEADDYFSSMGLQSVDDLLGPRLSASDDESLSKKKPKSKKKSSGADDFLHSFGLQTMDDIFGAELSNSDAESVSMEIPSKSDRTDINTESSIAYELGRPKPVPSTRVRSRENSAAYSEDFEESEIVTMSSAGDAGTKMAARVVGEADSESESDTLVESSDVSLTYSTETSFTDSSTYSQSRSVEIVRHRSVKSVEVEVQTTEMGLSYHWNRSMGQAYSTQAFGLGYTDPSPIATHTVSADALEAMTAYSPCVLALNDMLRQQLALTQQFIANQNRVYHSLIDGISADHQYTTLEDTKRYIEERRKTKLTFEEALRMVRQEMEEAK